MRAFLAAAVVVLALACGGPESGSGSVGPGQHSLHVTVSGPGAVHLAQMGMQCSVDCRFAVAAGSTVHLEALPFDGVTFSGWLGACSGRSTCDFKIDGDSDVLATFNAGPAGPAQGPTHPKVPPRGPQQPI